MADPVADPPINTEAPSTDSPVSSNVWKLTDEHQSTQEGETKMAHAETQTSPISNGVNGHHDSPEDVNTMEEDGEEEEVEMGIPVELEHAEASKKKKKKKSKSKSKRGLVSLPFPTSPCTTNIPFE